MAQEASRLIEVTLELQKTSSPDSLLCRASLIGAVRTRNQQRPSLPVVDHALPPIPLHDKGKQQHHCSTCTHQPVPLPRCSFPGDPETRARPPPSPPAVPGRTGPLTAQAGSLRRSGCSEAGPPTSPQRTSRGRGRGSAPSEGCCTRRGLVLWSPWDRRVGGRTGQGRSSTCGHTRAHMWSHARTRVGTHYSLLMAEVLTHEQVTLFMNCREPRNRHST